MKCIGKFLFYTLCISVLLSETAFAYLDPSVMTYAIQAVAGIAIVLGTVIGIAWRRVKKKAKQTLGIDENSKKEVEDDIQLK